LVNSTKPRGAQFATNFFNSNGVRVVVSSSTTAIESGLNSRDLTTFDGDSIGFRPDRAEGTP